jgi:hypothetical protein
MALEPIKFRRETGISCQEKHAPGNLVEHATDGMRGYKCGYDENRWGIIAATRSCKKEIPARIDLSPRSCPTPSDFELEKELTPFLTREVLGREDL